MDKKAATELMERALKHEFTDERKFVQALSCYLTIENMGQSPGEMLERYTFPMPPDAVFASTYSTFAGECGSEGISLDPEYRDWEKRANKVLDTLKKKKLPLTVENGNHAWAKTGPFARKKK